MVGIVVVSHSWPLARAAAEMAGQLLPGPLPRIELAAGLDEHTVGTDAVRVKEAIERAATGDGVLVLVDLGSALLSADLAVELLDDPVRPQVLVSPAPLIEGLLAAAATAAGGGSLAEVAEEAAHGLAGKQAQLGGSPPRPAEIPPSVPGECAAFVVHIPHGLHARPAARLVAAVRGLDANVQVANLTTGAGPVPATSLSRVATLGAEAGHRVEVTATGAAAHQAIEQVLALAGRQFDEVETAEPPLSAGTSGPVAASPGIAIGPVRHVRPPAPAGIAAAPAEAGDAEGGWRRLGRALDATRQEIARSRAQVGQPAEAAIFEVHLLLLDDADLLAAARSRIDAGLTVAQAWQAAYGEVERTFAGLPDPYLRARAADVRAVGEQALRHLVGAPPATALAREGILVAADLTPAEVLSLDRRLVQGVVLAGGSPTSHAAILARAHGLPMLVAAGPEVLDLAEGTPLVVDADQGTLLIAPDEATLAAYQRRRDDLRQQRLAAQRAAAGPAVTRDAVRIPVLANISSVADAPAAAAAGADGAGLVRTEFLFAGAEPPSVAEQVAIYREIVAAFGGHRVVFRTLDAGADKPLPFLPTEPEANPFLGVRGIRLSLRRPELLRDQLAAICSAADQSPVAVMFPMVSTVEEVRAALGILNEACAGRRPPGLQVGIMVEVPAVALKAGQFLPYVDFFSVGSNDLTQYALAVERGNPALASLVDPMDAGVLRLIEELCRQSAEVPVSVCGELAADPAATARLLSLGVRALSVSAPAVAAVKQAVRDTTIAAPETAAPGRVARTRSPTDAGRD